MPAVPHVSEAGEHVLRATGVGKKIDEAVLLPTDVELGSAECVVLRGPNRSGKTTLLRILAGTMSPSEGEATLDGSPVDERRDPLKYMKYRHVMELGAPRFRIATLLQSCVTRR